MAIGKRKITKIEYSCAFAESKSQNLVMSMFCSNSLIFAPESCKCILRGPDFNIFSQDMPQTPLGARTLAIANGAYGASFLLFCLLQSFCHQHKTLLKTLF